jgi:hypothetical protein
MSSISLTKSPSTRRKQTNRKSTTEHVAARSPATRKPKRVTPMPDFFVSLERAISQFARATGVAALSSSAMEHSNELAPYRNDSRRTADPVPCQTRLANGNPRTGEPSTFAQRFGADLDQVTDTRRCDPVPAIDFADSPAGWPFTMHLHRLSRPNYG